MTNLHLLVFMLSISFFFPYLISLEQSSTLRQKFRERFASLEAYQAPFPIHHRPRVQGPLQSPTRSLRVPSRSLLQAPLTTTPHRYACNLHVLLLLFLSYLFISTTFLVVFHFFFSLFSPLLSSNTVTGCIQSHPVHACVDLHPLQSLHALIPAIRASIWVHRCLETPLRCCRGMLLLPPPSSLLPPPSSLLPPPSSLLPPPSSLLPPPSPLSLFPLLSLPLLPLTLSLGASHLVLNQLLYSEAGHPSNSYVQISTCICIIFTTLMTMF